MKMLRNFVIAMVLMVSMINAGFASDLEHSLFVHVVGEKQIDLHMTGINGKVRLYLADNNGTIYHEEKLKVKDEVKLNLDLGDIKEGIYTLVLRDESKLQSIPVIVNGDDVKVEMDELSKVYFPKVNLENEVLTVKMLSNESNDLNVSIYSNEGALLFEEKIEGVVGLIGKQFKFLPGSYKVTLRSESYSEVKYYSFF